jgi:hypothetical protein
MMLKNTWYAYKNRVLILLLSIHSGSLLSMELVQKETPFQREQIAQIENIVLRERLYHTTEVFSYKTLCKLLFISKGMTKAILDPCQVERRRNLMNTLLMQHYTTLPAGIVYNDLGACGWVQPICMHCLLETPCGHGDQVSKKIPDMLCRAQLGSNKHLRIYKAYLPSEQTSVFIDLYHKMQAFPECNVTTKILCPEFYRSKSHSYSTDTRTPYFDQHNHLSVITGLKQLSEIGGTEEIRICRLSGFKKYTQHDCKIEIGDHIHRLKTLKYLPLFLQSALQTSNMQRIISKDTYGKTEIIFTGALTTENGNILEPDLYTVLGNMIFYLGEGETRTSHQKQLKHYCERQKIPWTNDIFLKAALCAKLGGSEELAIDHLEGYDASEAQQIDGNPTAHDERGKKRSLITFTPMGCITLYNDGDIGQLYSTYNGQLYSTYKKIIHTLETVQSIQDVIGIVHKKNRIYCRKATMVSE